MSTRVRVEFECDGGVYAGWRASQQLQLLAAAQGISIPAGLPKWSQLIYIYKHLGGSITHKRLVIFKERRKLSAGRSRYIKLCRDLGLGKKLKPLVARPTVPPTDALDSLRRAMERRQQMQGEFNVTTPARTERLTDLRTPGGRGVGISRNRIPLTSYQAVSQGLWTAPLRTGEPIFNEEPSFRDDDF